MGGHNCAEVRICVDYCGTPGVSFGGGFRIGETGQKITVLVDPEQFERFDAYCESHGFKKSTLICRLIREHLDTERFRLQGELLFAKRQMNDHDT